MSYVVSDFRCYIKMAYVLLGMVTLSTRPFPQRSVRVFEFAPFIHILRLEAIFDVDGLIKSNLLLTGGTIAVPEFFSPFLTDRYNCCIAKSENFTPRIQRSSSFFWFKFS
ncbi:hypothetical protein AVEN_145286-1 [Araneus ventricosus]|uniref:Uncharacterized protein n=1 Tax=Araneus ventricosus TaxID=182803 RepID=A0A4Y2GY73_ARAVE|nr:hypothetical protein AVEN_145286-1 [Araneus ventricosus]